jgi:hypothetical protein
MSTITLSNPEVNQRKNNFLKFLKGCKEEKEREETEKFTKKEEKVEKTARLNPVEEIKIDEQKNEYCEITNADKDKINTNHKKVKTRHLRDICNKKNNCSFETVQTTKGLRNKCVPKAPQVNVEPPEPPPQKISEEEIKEKSKQDVIKYILNNKLQLKDKVLKDEYEALTEEKLNELDMKDLRDLVERILNLNINKDDKEAASKPNQTESKENKEDENYPDDFENECSTNQDCDDNQDCVDNECVDNYSDDVFEEDTDENTTEVNNNNNNENTKKVNDIEEEIEENQLQELINIEYQPKKIKELEEKKKELEQVHDQKIKELEEKHKQEIQNIKTSDKETFNQAKQKYEEELEKLKTEQNKKLTNLTKETETKQEQLKKQLTQIKTKKQELEQQLKEAQGNIQIQKDRENKIKRLEEVEKSSKESIEKHNNVIKQLKKEKAELEATRSDNEKAVIELMKIKEEEKRKKMKEFMKHKGESLKEAIGNLENDEKFTNMSEIKIDGLENYPTLHDKIKKFLVFKEDELIKAHHAKFYSDNIKRNNEKLVETLK